MLLLVLSIGLSILFLRHALQRPILLDLKTYARAVLDVQQGRNPYRLDVPLRYVYHPLVLAVMSWFGPSALTWVIATVYLSCALLFIHALHGVLGRNTLPVLALAFAFGDAGVWSVLTGNLTAFMHLSLLAVLSYRAAEGAPLGLGFWVLLCVLTLIKPHFIGYGLIPVVIERDRRRQILCWLVAAVSCCAAILLAWWIARVWTERFVQALIQQTWGSGDLGMSFFGLFLRVLKRHELLAFYGHVVCASLLLALALIYCFTRERRAADESTAIGALYFALTWCSPRMMIYDFFPALVALATALVLEDIAYARHGAIALCIAAVPLLGLHMGMAFNSTALWQSIASLYLFALLVGRTHFSTTSLYGKLRARSPGHKAGVCRNAVTRNTAPGRRDSRPA